MCSCYTIQFSVSGDILQSIVKIERMEEHTNLNERRKNVKTDVTIRIFDSVRHRLTMETELRKQSHKFERLFQNFHVVS